VLGAAWIHHHRQSAQEKTTRWCHGDPTFVDQDQSFRFKLDEAIEALLVVIGQHAKIESPMAEQRATGL